MLPVYSIVKSTHLYSRRFSRLSLFSSVRRLSTSPCVLPCVFDSQRPMIHGDDMLLQKQTKLVFRHWGTVHVALQSHVRNLPFSLLWLVRSRGIFRALHHVDFNGCTVRGSN
jgi:hypothetical protein